MNSTTETVATLRYSTPKDWNHAKKLLEQGKLIRFYTNDDSWEVTNRIFANDKLGHYRYVVEPARRPLTREEFAKYRWIRISPSLKWRRICELNPDSLTIFKAFYSYDDLAKMDGTNETKAEISVDGTTWEPCWKVV